MGTGLWTRGRPSWFLSFFLAEGPLVSFHVMRRKLSRDVLRKRKTSPEHSRKGPRIIYLDLETQRSAQEVGGWRNCHLMKISVAGVYDTLEERFRIFREDQVDDLLGPLEKADLIVGFNIKRFDYDVIERLHGQRSQGAPHL